MRGNNNRNYTSNKQNMRSNVSDDQKIKDLETKRKQVRKNRNKIRFIYLLVFLIAALVCPTLIRKIAGRSPETFIVKTGTIEQSFSSRAIILRDEKLLESSMEGSCIPHYEEGEKVAAGRVVATVVSSASQEMLEEIRKLDMRIMQAREEASKQEEFFRSDIEKIDKEIENMARKIAQTSASGNIIKCRQYENNINNLLQKKADILNSTGDKNAFLNQLISQKNSLMESVKGKIEELKYEKAGVVSYVIDGYEKEFNLSYMSSIDSNSLEDSIRKLEENRINRDSSYNKVYAKITDELYYYIACTADLRDVNELKKDSAVTVRVNDNNMYIDMVVESIRKEEDKGKAVVILKSSIALGEMMSMRLIDVDVIIKKIDGMKVPVKSLMNYNNLNRTAEIACLKYSYVRIIPVKITGMDKDYAIIENFDENEQGFYINYNDIIITNPEKFEEGQLIY